MQLDLFTTTAPNQMRPTFKRKPHLEDVIEAISRMDIQWLEYLLDDNIMYSEFPKWVFIKKLKWVFDDFKENEDHFLKYYPGDCKAIKDKGVVTKSMVKGFRYIGNESKSYIDFVFETEGGNVTNITDSLDFRCPGTALFVKEQMFLRYRIIDGWNSANEIPF